MRTRSRWHIRTGIALGSLLVECLFFAMLGAGPVSAGGNALEGFCPFPISHDFPKVHGNRGHEVPGASPYVAFYTGQVDVVVTNLDTGASVEATSNGALFSLDEHTAYLRGQSVAFFDSPRGEVPAGVWVLDGNMIATNDDAGRITSVSGAIIRRDLCAELA